MFHINGWINEKPDFKLETYTLHLIWKQYEWIVVKIINVNIEIIEHKTSLKFIFIKKIETITIIKIVADKHYNGKIYQPGQWILIIIVEKRISIHEMRIITLKTIPIE